VRSFSVGAAPGAGLLVASFMVGAKGNHFTCRWIAA
jgi:hypothetical protein